jgi:hypothetical protein
MKLINSFLLSLRRNKIHLNFNCGSGNISKRQQQQQPLIVIFGWLGAKKRNMMKYTNLYLKHGFDCLDFLTPATMTFFPKQIPQMMNILCCELMDHYRRLRREKILQSGDEEEKEKEKKIVFHLLSLNGFYTYLMLIHHLQTRYLGSNNNNNNNNNNKNNKNNFEQFFSNISGCIIDSAPAYLTPQLAAKGFVGFLLNRLSNQVMKYPSVSFLLFVSALDS